MNKLKHVMAFALVLIIALSLPVSAYAATHDAYNSGDVADAFNTDSDTNITITLKADIEMADTLTARTGKIIVINGESYILKDVEFVGDTTGGSVTVNADIGATAGNTALSTGENAAVKINGDVTGSAGAPAVEAAGNSKVTITGDVAGGDNTAAGESGGEGVIVYDDASVTVSGSVTGGDSTLTDAELTGGASADGGDAVIVNDTGSVIILGSVQGGDGTGYDGSGGDGAVVNDSAAVAVGGSASGGNVNAAPGSGVVIAPPSSATATAGNGIYAAPQADATVSGNVTGGSTNVGDAGDGIVLLTLTPVSDPGSVNVGGTVTGGTSSDPNGENGAALYLDIGSGVTTISNGSTANVTAWKLSDASGKMVEASDSTMQAKAQSYIANKVIYPVYVSQPKNGTIRVSTNAGVAGTRVEVTVDWADNANLLKFKGIFYGSGQAREIAKNTYEFNIPAGGGVIVYAGFDVPLTGDSGSPVLWLSLMLISAPALAYPLLRRRKEQ